MYDKLKCLNDRMRDRWSKYNKEKDYGKRQRIRLEIQILELRIKLEKVKKK